MRDELLVNAVVATTAMEQFIWEKDTRPVSPFLLNLFPRSTRKQTVKWITKDGRKLRICDMESTHIWNTLHFLYKSAWTRKANLVYSYLATPGPNGDMAQVAFEQESDGVFDSSWECYIPEAYRNLLFEALRRDLDVPLKLIPSDYR